MTRKPSLGISNLSEVIQLVRDFARCSTSVRTVVSWDLVYIYLPLGPHSKKPYMKRFGEKSTKKSTDFLSLKEKSSFWNDGTLFFLTLKEFYEKVPMGSKVEFNAHGYCERHNQLQASFTN